MKRIAAMPDRDPGGPRRDGRLEEGLHIDRDDLDGGLVEQPDRYYHVALAAAEAAATRDAAKFDLEEVQANLDVKIRADAAAAGEKMTEAGIQQEMRLDPRYGEARRHYLELAADVDRLVALKEAFQQRSFMLRELVALTIAERGDQAGAAGAYEARGRRAQAAYDVRAEHMRSRRRDAAAPGVPARTAGEDGR